MALLIFVAVTGLAFHARGNSSWIVLAAWGALQTAAHFAAKWTDIVASLFPLFYLFPFALASAFGETGPRTAHPWASAWSSPWRGRSSSRSAS